MIKKLMALVFMVAVSACGGVPDTSDEDIRDLTVHREVMPDGSEVVTYTVGDIDTTFGSLTQGLGSIPDRFGVDNGLPAQNPETRCPSGGYVAPSQQVCLIPSTKTRNWNFQGIDASWNARLGLTNQGGLNAIFIQSLSFIHNGVPTAQENVDRFQDAGFPIDAKAVFDTAEECVGGYLCTDTRYGSTIDLDGSKRYRSSKKFNGLWDRIVVNPQHWLNAHGGTVGTPTQQYFTFRNLSAHEMGHAWGYGHVPTAVFGGDIMNLENGGTNSAIKNWTAAENSQRAGFHVP